MNVCCNVCQKTQIKKSGDIRRKNTINNYYTKKEIRNVLTL